MNLGSELHKAILNNIPDQAWLKDVKSRYVLVNEAFMAACGLTEAQILHKTPADVWPLEWGNKYIETDKRVIQSGASERYEEIRKGEDGSLRCFDTIKTALLNKRGKVIGTVGISRDITERKQAEAELEKINRMYSVRSKTNQAIVRISDKKTLFETVCKIAVQSGGLALAWIGSFSDKGAETITDLSSYSNQPRKRQSLMRTLGADSDPDFITLRDKPFQRHICNDTGNTRKKNSHAMRCRELGFSSFAVFPIVQGKRQIGLFVLYATEMNFFSKDIVQLLQALSSDLSFAVDFIEQTEQRERIEKELIESRSQLRELSAYLQTVREEERTRIARELHDELGQSLTAIRIGLSVIEKHKELGHEEWTKNLQSLKEIAESTVESVQRIASDLRPSILDELGLPAALEWLLELFSEHTGIAYEISLPNQVDDFGMEINTTLFRIIQESLTNIGKHSKATFVKVQLTGTKKSLILKIMDNGLGIEKSSGKAKKHLGLVGMRERALMLGGRLKIESEPGNGTNIILQIPRSTSTDLPQSVND
ncbi:PAS domain-containing protein [Oxalobacteraceae bacterium R-40]|uniref:PAS domain-containing protein n=1 Tax=Keguizhuia sedimenti TaxID=3064264 RepID=A0ABU1BKS6_9BURK|nr:PAS domain-containing protein [Oxalobacteraceae bacterium R-40]